MPAKKKAKETNGDVMEYIKAQKALVELHDDDIRSIRNDLRDIKSRLDKALNRLGIS